MRTLTNCLVTGQCLAFGWMQVAAVAIMCADDLYTMVRPPQPPAAIVTLFASRSSRYPKITISCADLAGPVLRAEPSVRLCARPWRRPHCRIPVQACAEARSLLRRVSVR